MSISTKPPEWPWRSKEEARVSGGAGKATAGVLLPRDGCALLHPPQRGTSVGVLGATPTSIQRHQATSNIIQQHPTTSNVIRRHPTSSMCNGLALSCPHCPLVVVRARCVVCVHTKHTTLWQYCGGSPLCVRTTLAVAARHVWDRRHFFILHFWDQNTFLGDHAHHTTRTHDHQWAVGT